MKNIKSVLPAYLVNIFLLDGIYPLAVAVGYEHNSLASGGSSIGSLNLTLDDTGL